jgi:hypothetical protein
MKIKDAVAVVEAMIRLGRVRGGFLKESYELTMAMIKSGELDPEAEIDDAIAEKEERIADALQDIAEMRLLLDVAEEAGLPEDATVGTMLWVMEARALHDPALRAKLRAMGYPSSARNRCRPTEAETAGTARKPWRNSMTNRNATAERGAPVRPRPAPATPGAAPSCRSADPHQWRSRQHQLLIGRLFSKCPSACHQRCHCQRQHWGVF